VTERRKHPEYRQVDVVRLVYARPQHTALPLCEVGSADRGRSACSRTRLGAGETRSMRRHVMHTPESNDPFRSSTSQPLGLA
jgi:hypothetical protein